MLKAKKMGWSLDDSDPSGSLDISNLFNPFCFAYKTAPKDATPESNASAKKHEMACKHQLPCQVS